MKNKISGLNQSLGNIESPNKILRFSRFRQNAVSLIALGFVATGIVASASSTQAQVLLSYGFEVNTPATGTGLTSTAISPDVNNTGATASFVIHPGAATNSTFSSVAGNGSAHAASANNWTTGGYFQFSLSTANFAGPLGISYDQAGSSTGPADFAVQYSTDSGANFVTLAGSAYTIAAGSFASGTVSSSFNHSFDFTSVPSVDSAASVIFRIVEQDTVAIGTAAAPGGTVGSGGTDRIDNFIVQTVPEPTTVLGGMLLVAVACWSQRRRLSAAITA